MLADLESFDASVRFLKGDVGDPAACRDCVDQVLEGVRLFGRTCTLGGWSCAWWSA